jgi:hypothetical protein
MKIIQSFWSGKNKSIQNNYGWFDYQYHWLSWMLSCHQLRKFYDQVELYTDTFGYEILIEKLKLPYTKVHVVLDELNELPDQLWAMAKIKVYSLQQEPFLHVDGDIFIFEAFPQQLMRADLIAQNQETTTNYYRDNWAKIVPKLDYLPAEMEDFDKGVSDLAYNMGIFGGNDLVFLKEYSQESLSFVYKNQAKLEDINPFNFNVFFEQVFFYEKTKAKSKEVGTLIIDNIGDNEYEGFADFYKVPKDKTYLHLLGFFKQQEFVCKKMEQFCLVHYPHFFKILKELTTEKYEFPVNYGFNKESNKELIKWYEINLMNEEIDNKKLLARDLYCGSQVSDYLDFQSHNEDFHIVLLPEIIFEEESDIIKLFTKELKGKLFVRVLDAVDQILLHELSIKSKLYSDLFDRFLTYFDDNPTEKEYELALKTFEERINYYLDNKLVAVLLTNNEALNSEKSLIA